jgi:hypothetical protein
VLEHSLETRTANLVLPKEQELLALRLDLLLQTKEVLIGPGMRLPEPGHDSVNMPLSRVSCDHNKLVGYTSRTRRIGLNRYNSLCTPEREPSSRSYRGLNEKRRIVEFGLNDLR